MPRMIQIRNVPDATHREIKARAALAGMSLSDYLLAELRRSLDRPTRDDLIKRVAARTSTKVRPQPAAAVRTERERR